MSNDFILTRKKGGVCTLTMSRPGGIMNALNSAMMDQLQKGLEKIAFDEGIRVAILQGAGEHFSAGADMSLLKERAGAPESLGSLKRLGILIRYIRELPIPVISKVRGVAYGAGVNIALAGDFVVAAHDARFCEVFVNLGILMDGGGTYFLPRLVGLAKGLIYKSVPPEALDREVDTLAQKFTQKSRKAVALIKEGLEGSLDMSLKEVLEWEASHQSIMLQTPELKEAVQKFLKSRGKQ
jgi:2-(1,2-epoxy-1,2-dihydrophenyl)acetyl-CoA isomerase